MRFPHSGKVPASRGRTGVDPASALLEVGKGRAAGASELGVRAGREVCTGRGLRKPGGVSRKVPELRPEAKPRGCFPRPTRSCRHGDASSLQGCPAPRPSARSPRGPPPRAPRVVQSAPVVGVSCVLHGARAPPGPPAASASDLALPVPAGSLTSVFVRLPCGGVGVSVPLACT